jgi:hypothetical protein
MIRNYTSVSVIACGQLNYQQSMAFHYSRQCIQRVQVYVALFSFTIAISFLSDFTLKPEIHKKMKWGTCFTIDSTASRVTKRRHNVTFPLLT